MLKPERQVQAGGVFPDAAAYGGLADGRPLTRRGSTARPIPTSTIPPPRPTAFRIAACIPAMWKTCSSPGGISPPLTRP